MSSHRGDAADSPAVGVDPGLSNRTTHVVTGTVNETENGRPEPKPAAGLENSGKGFL